jgi:hypothetical protein
MRWVLSWFWWWLSSLLALAAAAAFVLAVIAGTDTTVTAGSAILMVQMGSVVVGIVSGVLQGFAFRWLEPNMVKTWIGATIAGGFAIPIGLSVSGLSRFAVTGAGGPGTCSPCISPLVDGLVAGIASGVMFGQAQWYVLARYFPRASLWLPACLIGWGGGFVAFAISLESQMPLEVVLATFAIPGAITGLALPMVMQAQASRH